MPYSMFCPVSLIIAKALSDDDFNPSFGSVQALFDRPIFGNTACVDLVWKKEIMDQEIFPMSYSVEKGNGCTWKHSSCKIVNRPLNSVNLV